MTRVKHILLFSLIAIFFGMVLESKPSFAAFTTSDLQGTWRLHILTTMGEWIRGPLIIDDSGNYSFTTETSEGDSEGTTGEVIISSNGIITMTDRPGLQGVMSRDKNFFVMTETWDFDIGVYEFALFIGVKQGNGPFGPSDFAGTWQGHHLVSGEWNGWERDTITFDSAGYSTAQVADSDGKSETEVRSQGDISGNGIITVSEWEPLQGVMNHSKNLLVITNTKSEGICEMGIIMKEGESFSSQDLEGTWYGHTLLVGSWKAWTRSTWNMDGTGNFQFGYENFDGSSGTGSGTLDVSDTGIITVEGDPNVQGVMSMDKNIMTWTQGWDGNVYALAVLVKAERTKVSGSISYEGTPLCAMALANGQYMFTCGDDLGSYDLDVPLDGNGKITLYGFCSGMAPFKTVLSPPQALSYDITMANAATGSAEMTIHFQTEPGTTNTNWVRVWGTVTYGANDLCAMALANGQHMFSCGADLGQFDLEVPLDAHGEITLYVFCSGMAPYKNRFVPLE